jgi:heme oxygenase
MTALKTGTAATHEQVEDHLALLDPALDRVRLAAVLSRFHAFWSPTEVDVDDWIASTGPDDADLVAELDWPRRRRTRRLAADLRALDVTAEPPGGGAFRGLAGSTAPVDTAAVLGWLYVSEGSTLGGAVLTRHLAGLTDALGVHLVSFAPYDEGPGPMWRRFGATAEAWVGTDAARSAAVVAAAQRAFDALAAWVAPLAGRAAA